MNTQPAASRPQGGHALCVAIILLAGVFASPAQPVQELISAYSGQAAWDGADGLLTFTSSGGIEFPAAGARSFIWQIPAEVKRIRIGKNVTVNGAFHSHDTVLICGEDRKTSVVFGTAEQSWADKRKLKAYEVSAFQNFGGTMTISNLTSLNPRAFHVRGWKLPVRVHSCDFIDNRGGWGNHSDGFEGGDGSTVDNCYFESGDDIIKVYFDVTVTDTTIKMVRNSVPIQLGWGDYSDGAVGTFKNLTVIGNGGRPNEGNAIISGRKGRYDVTLNIDGCKVENPNGTWVSLREDTMTLRGSVTNAHIRLKSYAGEFQKGTNLMTIGGSTEHRAAYNCANSRARPNVLFIAVDDLNHWVGYLGRNPQTLTPNMDRLAKRGLWFTHSYCAAPVCNPSRAALMSGLRPGATGIYDNGENFAPVIPTDLTLTTQFRKAGYYVCGAGKIYHGSVYRPEEWDDWQRGAGGKAAREEDDASQAGVHAGKLPLTPLTCRDEDMPDFKFVDYAIAQLKKPHDKPFFIACGLTKPHLPWSVPKKYYAKFPLDSIQLPPYQEDDLEDLPPIALQFANGPANDHEAILKAGGTNTWKQAIQAYLASINFCDAMVGRLLDAYDQSPERDNTILCFWSDHGWHLGEKHHWRKFALWEETTRSPHIWVVPGVTKPDSRCDRTVDYMSIYPTLMDLCGLPTPDHVQGRSIRALLANPQMPWDQPAVTTYRQNNHTVRSEGWRYTHYSDGGEELYNEVRDPYEWTNLAKKPGESDAVKNDLGKYLPGENKAPAKGGAGKLRKNRNLEKSPSTN